MNLYEIDQAIFSCIDPETGEIADYEAFERLQMEKDRKIENVALWYKNLVAEAAALKAEEKAFAERRKAAENRAERLKGFLDTVLQGSPVKTTKFTVSYRKSEQTVVDDLQLIPEKFLRRADPTADKSALKAAIKGGEEIPGVHLETVRNISIM